jgi:hypothetical protein
MKQKSENKKKKSGKAGHREYPLPGEINPEQNRQNVNAHQQAEKDMANDAEFVAHNKNDDLDEGETARLGENTDLV